MSKRTPWVAVVAWAVLTVSCVSSHGNPSAKGTPSTARSTSSPATATVLRVQRAPFALPFPVQREVAVMVSGRVYLAGGLDTSDVSISDVVAVDTAKGTAEVTGSMPNAFHDAAGAVIGGRLFVFAGGTGQGSDVVQSFDPASGAGRIERGSLPEALSDLSSAETGGVVYLVGGFDNVSPQRSIYATQDGEHFSVVGTLLVGLRYPAVVAQGAEVVIAGGQTASGLTDDVLVFDPATGRVRTIGHLPQPLAHAAAFVLGNTVYVAGGRNEAGVAVRGIESVDITTGKIRPVAKLPSSLADSGVVAEGQKVWFFGGWRGAPVTDVLVASLVPA